MLLLRAAACILILVPGSTAAVLAFFPGEIARIPVGFWLVWFVISVWTALDAPLRVSWFLPDDALNQNIRYGKTGTVLGLANVIWSIAFVIYLGWWS